MTQGSASTPVGGQGTVSAKPVPVSNFIRAETARKCGKGRWIMVAMHVRLSAIAAIGLSLSSAAPTYGQSYPDRTIKIVVPYPAGGPTDVMARLIAQRLSASFGQAVIVDNRPGAGGTIGTKVVASARPDGYTLQLANLGALVISPALYKTVDYDPLTLSDTKHSSSKRPAIDGHFHKSGNLRCARMRGGAGRTRTSNQTVNKCGSSRPAPQNGTPRSIW